MPDGRPPPAGAQSRRRAAEPPATAVRMAPVLRVVERATEISCARPQREPAAIGESCAAAGGEPEGRMHLVQLLLPLYDNDGHALPRSYFTQVAAELTAQFGGVTAYLRAPARGVWQEDEGGDVAHDDIVLHEVMVDGLDRAWWAAYGEKLRGRFGQQELVIRAHPLERL